MIELALLSVIVLMYAMSVPTTTIFMVTLLFVAIGTINAR